MEVEARRRHGLAPCQRVVHAAIGLAGDEPVGQQPDQGDDADDGQQGKGREALHPGYRG